MYNLFIYQPGTGTMISLSDDAYVIDADELTEEQLEEAVDGCLSVDALPPAIAWMTNEKVSALYRARFRRFTRRGHS